jgi:hypothetical protein
MLDLLRPTRRDFEVAAVAVFFHKRVANRLRVVGARFESGTAFAFLKSESRLGLSYGIKEVFWELQFGVSWI